ncbi:MAG: aldehyde dehydrogenase EutE [Calditrichia bacterium]|nr:aldehyde dehydrogenase EutE [Calditrichia bacterium]
MKIPVPEVHTSGTGIFNDLDSAVQAAKAAQQHLMRRSLEKRNEIITSIRKKMLLHAEDLATRAYEETGLGRKEDKIIKNNLVIKKTPGAEFLTPSAQSGDRGLMLMEFAPYGVIGTITPVTNPTSTIICNTIGMLAAGNAIVFNVHPSAKKVSLYNIGLLNDAIKEAEGPANMITTVAEPTIESAQQLMRHKDIRLLVVTGGAGVVREAMTSGKRAICAGPGNPPVVVDETADIDQAAKGIISGASMDNNIICVDEKEVFVVASVADQLFAAFTRYNAVVLNPQQISQLEKVIFSENKGPGKPAVMNKDYIGKNAKVILEQIGINVEDKIRLAVAPVAVEHPLVWSEQMMPVLPVVRMPDPDSAIDIAIKAERGFGHTAVMYSKNLDNLSRMAREANCSIFVKNGPSYSGLGHGGEGYCSFSIASPTGEGLTNSRSFSRERRCVMVDHFRIV